MLDRVKEVLPYGQNEWQRVADIYNVHDGVTHVRDADAVRRKFMKLKNTRKPTGHPTCPPHVRRAKHIWADIEGRASVLGLCDGQDSEPDEATMLDTNAASELEPLGDGTVAIDNYGLQGAVAQAFVSGDCDVRDLDGERDVDHDEDRDGVPDDDHDDAHVELPAFGDEQEVQTINRPAPRTAARSSRAVAIPTGHAARGGPRRVHVDRTGLSPTALSRLSSAVRAGQVRTAPETGLLSQTAKKRRQLDGYIDTIGQNLSGGRNIGAQSDLAMLMMMQQSRDAATEERRLAAEERRLEREEKRQADQAAREQAREERDDARRHEQNQQLLVEKREREEQRRADDQRNARAEQLQMLIFAKICRVDVSSLNN